MGLRLTLFVLAYNSGTSCAGSLSQKEVLHRSLSNIQLKLFKIGAKTVSQSRNRNRDRVSALEEEYWEYRLKI